jgi:choice-of-anchor B domain-containing protein
MAITRRPNWQRLGVSTLATAIGFAALASGASAHHPGLSHKEHAAPGLGMQVNSPAELADFFPGVQWDGSGKVDDQTAELVYAGTGCTPASYATVADRVRGNIALIDDRVSATNPNDQCPSYTFAQKVQSAERAGAIGLVGIPREGTVPDGGSALAGGIPALEIDRTPDTLAVRDAVIAGTAVNATLTPPPSFPAMSNLPCTDGMAGPFPCDGIDLLSFIPAEEFNGAGQSDLWGWTDPETGDEYVFMGKTNGTAFFRITDPVNPVYLGELPNPGVDQRVWHDMKVYENHAFIVSESEPHGMMVFDLTRLRGVTEPQTWDQDAHYRMHSAAHNIAINTETGFAYIVGGNAGIVAPDHCLSGLHMVDISTPKEPTFAGCYLEEGGPGTAARTVGPEAEAVSPAAYVHDAECVIYRGPDTEHTGREVCFNAAENKVVVADVTDKLAPKTLGITDYPNVTYAHQGSLTADHRFLLVNDELDETTHGTNTRTIVLDVSDLDNPKLHFEHFHPVGSIDHNNYVHQGRVYQSNYTSGLRVLSTGAIDDPDNPRLEPVAFFDSYPAHTDPTFNGTWSNYPYFESGTIPISGIDEGLFLLRLSEDADTVERGVELTCDNCPPTIKKGKAGTADLTVRNTGNVDDSYRLAVDDLPDGWSASIAPESVSVSAGDAGEAILTIDVPKKTPDGSYTLTVGATSAADPDVSDAERIQVEVGNDGKARTARR